MIEKESDDEDEQAGRRSLLEIGNHSMGSVPEGSDGLVVLLMRIMMDRTNTINTFEELFLTSPFNRQKSRDKAFELLADTDIDKDVYDETIMNKSRYSKFSRPPKCIFVPS